jgi:hypothetical protein
MHTLHRFTKENLEQICCEEFVLWMTITLFLILVGLSFSRNGARENPGDF